MDAQLPGLEAVTGATFDPSGRFRFRLWRAWGPAEAGRVAFVMVNPSTADAQVLDPTIRRCVGFARAWEFGRLDVVNLFPVRSTDPGNIQPDKASAPEPEAIAAENLGHVLDVARAATVVIVAWGKHGRIADRDDLVAAQLRQAGIRLYCFGQNLDGTPVHPLYQPTDQPLIRYPDDRRHVRTPEQLRTASRAGLWPPALQTVVHERYLRGTGTTEPRGFLE